MTLAFTKHEKISLRRHPIFNEKWLHDRICEDATILGLGDVRVLDRERVIRGGGRLDLLLLDEDNDRRYEVEIQLGATDPSHIIRCIEYWDAERRHYPGYEHIAVIIAEDITARFLNVMSLLAGSISLVAIQLDALKVGEQLLLHFTQVLDQRDLRVDDTIEDDGGGGEADRAFWDKKAGAGLMKTCDDVLAMINKNAKTLHSLNYLRGYVGLQSNGVVDNFIYMSPKPSKKFTHVNFRNSNADEWKAKLEEAGVPVSSKQKDRLRVTVSPQEFSQHQDLIRDIVASTVSEREA
jgi:hypothetical protein